MANISSTSPATEDASSSKISRFKDLRSVEDLLKFLTAHGQNHTGGYSHYTTWGNLQKIMDGCSFLLTKGNSPNINDQQEWSQKGSLDLWDKTYLASFSYGTAENMAMWGLYGLPWTDAVRLTIPRKAMLQWLRSLTSVYPWKNGHRGDPITGAEITLSDLVYVNEPSGENLKLSYPPTGETISAKNIDDLRNADTEPKMTGFLKSYAWQYEKEVRLLVRLPAPYDTDRILVDIPPEVVGAIQITTGPNFVAKSDPLYQKLNAAGRIHPSAFTGLVKYRPLCALCKYEAFEPKEF